MDTDAILPDAPRGPGPDPRRHEITLDPARIDTARVAVMLRRTAWAGDLTDADLILALDHSLPVAAIERRTGATVGFARVVSDRVTFAYLTDVIVDEAHRGEGLARRLSERALTHPELARVGHWALLASHERVGFLYGDLGFAGTDHQHAWMERFDR